MPVISFGSAIPSRPSIVGEISRSEPFAFLSNSNGSITRLVRMPDGRWVLVAFNETAHLPREWQPGGAGGAVR